MIEPRMGGKGTLRIAIQESHDIINSLLSLEQGGGKLTHALRDLVRERYDGAYDVEIIRLPFGRSDLLLRQFQALAISSEFGQQPEAVESDVLKRGAVSGLLQTGIDVVVTSILPDVTRPAPGHYADGCPASPRSYKAVACSQTQPERPPAQTTATGLMGPDQFQETLLRLIRSIKQSVGAHVIVYNASPFDPGDDVYNYYGTEDTASIRAQKLILAVMRLSIIEGISIINVERIVGELGAMNHVVGLFDYSSDSYTGICREFMRVLEDIGFFERRPLTMQVGRGHR